MNVQEFSTAAEMVAAYKARMVRMRTAVASPVVVMQKPRSGTWAWRMVYKEPIGPKRPERCTGVAIMTLRDFDGPPLATILQIVSEASGIGLKDIVSMRRSRHLVRARMVFYWCAKTFTAKSFPQIGEIAGDRDHSTVMHGVQCVTDDHERFEPLLSRVVKELKKAGGA